MTRATAGAGTRGVWLGGGDGPGYARPGPSALGDLGREVLGPLAAVSGVLFGLPAAVLVSDTTLAIEFLHGDTRVIRRTTTQPVRSIKGQRPRAATPIS